ncbi:MAG: FadR family transcriptional regulator [Limnohabitans sp.]|nr:FadR family transcriptional regulator [Limnohabitans sp.]
MAEIQLIPLAKASNTLAAKLRRKILDGEICQGMALPNERDLAAQTCLSRTSVREALRILEADGLINIRTGRNGGAEVVRPDISTVERSIDIFIRGQGIKFQSVLETREAIEPPAARLAALYHNSNDWAKLTHIHQQMQADIENVEAFLKHNLDWHISVVQAGHNELLIAFAQAISRSVYEATNIQGFNLPHIRQAVVVAHQKVMDAIELRQEDSAARRMGRHINSYIDNVKAKKYPCS